jgi:hypothetical protein
MPFIETIPPAAATGETRAMYARQQAHYGYVPSYATVFSHRPEVMARWGQLLAAIKRPMDKRRFELATLAAAQTLKSTLCSMAHGKALLEFLPAEDVAALGLGEIPATLTAAEASLVRFARAVARDASAVTAADVAALKRHFDDDEIFDIAAAAAGRAFFTKIIEALGVETDAPAKAMDAELRDALAVGRSVTFVEPQRLPDVPAADAA